MPALGVPNRPLYYRAWDPVRTRCVVAVAHAEHPGACANDLLTLHGARDASPHPLIFLSVSPFYSLYRLRALPLAFAELRQPGPGSYWRPADLSCVALLVLSWLFRCG